MLIIIIAVNFPLVITGRRWLMSKKQKPITPLGWLIIKRLAEKKMTRKEFCQQENIPESRLSNLITGLRPAVKYRKKVMDALGIGEDEIECHDERKT